MHLRLVLTYLFEILFKVATPHSPFLHQPPTPFSGLSPLSSKKFRTPPSNSVFFYEKMWPLHILFWWKLILTATKSMFSSRPSSTYLVCMSSDLEKLFKALMVVYIFHIFPVYTPRNSRQKAPPWKFHKIVINPLEIPNPKTKTAGNSTLFFLGHP